MALPIPVPSPSAVDEARFWSKVHKEPSGCWVWTAAKFVQGYGMFNLDGKARRAHRVAYVWTKGEHGEAGLDHLCRNRACVNPDHLEPVTPKVNVVDRGTGHTAVNARKETCAHGHDDWCYPNKTPGRERWRQCRTCNRLRAREYQRGKRVRLG